MATNSTASLKTPPNGSTIESVKLDELNVDDSYQREPKTWLVQDIFNNYDKRAYGLITVSEREDGTKWIVDGLQRATAASWLDMTEIDAEVFHGLTRMQEADLRLKKNRRQNETSSERFKAKLAMKDKQAMGVLKICRDFDLFIAVDTPEALRDKSVHAIGAFEKIYGIDQGIELRRILMFFNAAFGDVKAMHVTSSMMWMMHWTFTQHEKFDEKRMQKAMQTRVTALKQHGKMYAAQYGGSVWVNMYRYLIEQYNEGLPKKAQLEPIMRGYRGIAGGPSGGSEGA